MTVKLVKSTSPVALSNLSSSNKVLTPISSAEGLVHFKSLLRIDREESQMDHSNKQLTSMPNTDGSESLVAEMKKHQRNRVSGRQNQNTTKFASDSRPCTSWYPHLLTDRDFPGQKHAFPPEDDGEQSKHRHSK